MESSGKKALWYFLFRNSHKDFLRFHSQEGKLVYCFNMDTPMESLVQQQDPNECSLCMDFSKLSLKAEQFYNWYKYPSVPTAHAVR
jgi:hypothetical protein